LTTQTQADRPPDAPSPGTNPTIRGVCSVVFCYDVGFSIDLNRAADLLTRSASLPNPQRERLQLRRKAPKYFNFDPAPLRVQQQYPSREFAGFHSAPVAETTLYDFGGASVVYSIPIRGNLSDLLPLANALSDNQEFLNDSRKRLDELISELRPAILRPRLGELVEDYATYQLDQLGDGGESLNSLLDANRALLAQILRGESTPLSDQEVSEALGVRISYSKNDAAILDFAAAFVIDPDASDLLDLIEFANVELLEMRSLDETLDDALEEVYPILSRRERAQTWGWVRARAGARRMRRVAELQVDAAVLFEQVDNAIKLVGDHYLARFYKRLSDRLHHPEWDASVLRKLSTLENIYQKLSDQQSTRRMEVLEWIIIVLIALSMLLPFFPFFHK
jgi:hypothetical protein